MPRNTFKFLNVFICILHVLACPDALSPDRSTSQGLCPEFQLFRDLIPKSELTAIVLRHYNFDKQFKNAVDFLFSDKFDSMAAQIETSRPYRALLFQFRMAGVNVSDISTIDRIISCFIPPGQKSLVKKNSEKNSAQSPGIVIVNKNHNYISVNANANFEPQDKVQYEPDTDYFDEINTRDKTDERFSNLIAPRSVLPNIMTEISSVIPRDKVKGTIAQAISHNSDFYNFYKIIRSSKFANDLKKALRSKQLSRCLSTLRRNGIDIRKILGFVADIISLGP